MEKKTLNGILVIVFMLFMAGNIFAAETETAGILAPLNEEMAQVLKSLDEYKISLREAEAKQQELGHEIESLKKVVAEQGQKTAEQNLTMSKLDKSLGALKGWSFKGSHIIMGFGHSGTTGDTDPLFDRGRLNVTKEFKLFDRNAGVRFTLETFLNKDSGKNEFFLKYAYPWVEVLHGLKAKAGWVEGPVVGPEEMGIRGLGGRLGKSMVDVDLGLPSNRLGGGLDYNFDLHGMKGNISTILGKGAYFGNNKSWETYGQLFPFASRTDIFKNFFVGAGGLYEWGELGDTTLLIGRTGLYDKDRLELSMAGLTTSGSANRLVKMYPGLKSFKDGDVSNTGLEALGRAYPWKIAGSQNGLKDLWFMARYREIFGDWGYKSVAALVGYDVNKFIRFGIGPEWVKYSEETGVLKDNDGSEMRIFAGVEVKF